MEADDRGAEEWWPGPRPAQGWIAWMRKVYLKIV